MQIRIQDANQLQLDWLITSIEEPRACEYGVADWRDQRAHTVKHGEHLYRYCQSWAQGGPIIDREKITVGPIQSEWVAYRRNPRDGFVAATPLIAAMRCFAVSKLGETAEVPDELCEGFTQRERPLQ